MTHFASSKEMFKGKQKHGIILLQIPDDQKSKHYTVICVAHKRLKDAARGAFLDPYTGWPKLKYPSSKFAISWQQQKILRPNLQQLLSTNQRINPQNYVYIPIKKTNLQCCKDESTIFQIYRLTQSETSSSSASQRHKAGIFH